MARAVVPLNFNAFLEKVKLKDDGSNYTDWVHNLRIILIVAQKNYVLEAPLGARQFCTCGILRLNLTSLACTDMASEHGDRKVEHESDSRYDQHGYIHR